MVGSQVDVMCVFGCVYVQECYFEMDLMCCSVVGELFVLFGLKVIDVDKCMCVYCLCVCIEVYMDVVLGDNGDVVCVYVDGVNEGFVDFFVWLWVYLLLWQLLQFWQVSDSVLIGLVMYVDLQDFGNQIEFVLSCICVVVLLVLYVLIVYDGIEWDVLLFGELIGNVMLFDVSQLDLCMLEGKLGIGQEEVDVVGSNNFVVVGVFIVDGCVIVVDDMYLGLCVFGLWFCVCLCYLDLQVVGGQVDVIGFLLLGFLVVIVGSNGYIVWGFINSYIDIVDYCIELVNVVVMVYEEWIVVVGQVDVLFLVCEIVWGLILYMYVDGSGDVLCWVVQLFGVVCLDFGDLVCVGDLDVVLQFVDYVGIFVQNLVVGDCIGCIVWCLIGVCLDCGLGCVLVGFNVVYNQDCVFWLICSDVLLVLIDFFNYCLWIVNGCVFDGEVLVQVGNGGYDFGVRGWQICDLLVIQECFDEYDLLVIQFDDCVVFLQCWWVLLYDVIECSDDFVLKCLKEVSY